MGAAGCVPRPRIRPPTPICTLQHGVRCGPCQNGGRCRYAALGSTTNTRNHGTSSLQRGGSPEQHVSACNPTANVCTHGRLRASFHPISPSPRHSLWRVAVNSLPLLCIHQLPYHHDSPARSGHILLYCSSSTFAPSYGSSLRNQFRTAVIKPPS